MSHAVSNLRNIRLAASRKPYVARGSGGGRCTGCRLAMGHCICALRPAVNAQAGVCLIMGDIEALKPSNTGWLVADLVPNTFAFGWSRTEVDPGLIAVLTDPQWQPFLVFPAEFAEPDRRVTQVLQPPSEPPVAGRPQPLFVLLDGTWAEARKMFRKSPYLDRLPVLGLQPEQVSNYRLRRSVHGHHLCTAEVAALCLWLAGEGPAAERLLAWLDVFTTHSLSVRLSLPLDRNSPAHQRLQALSLPPASDGGKGPAAQSARS